jgi:hypothetical protein
MPVAGLISISGIGIPPAPQICAEDGVGVKTPPLLKAFLGRRQVELSAVVEH